mmetsp:Transcript_21257/g.61380  ORF Transcript_21257/g.61380 Transcript_21257/m.61380 type:complete len:252 (+) Transcript_21257:227-982(+)
MQSHADHCARCPDLGCSAARSVPPVQVGDRQQLADDPVEARPVGRLARGALLENAAERLWHGAGQLQCGALCHHHDNLGRLQALKGGRARAELPQDNPESIHVDLLCERAALELEELRRHVRHRAHGRCVDAAHAAVQHPRKAEVAHLARVALRAQALHEQHVARGEVAVDDPARVHVGDRGCDLGSDLDNLVHVAPLKLLANQLLVQRAEAAPLLHYPHLEAPHRAAAARDTALHVADAVLEGLHQIRVR